MKEAYQGKSMMALSLQGSAQAHVLRDELTRAFQAGPGLTEMLNRGITAGISRELQGDERDVIFLSLVASSQREVGMRAMMDEETVRRFNVAMSRARDQVVLFHSLQPEDLNPEDLRFAVLTHCLEMAGQNHMAGLPLGTELPGDVDLGTWQDARFLNPEGRLVEPRDLGMPFDSWFEFDVFWDLKDRGYLVVPQVAPWGRGDGCHAIDMVVVGHGGSLAIECDGTRWHGEDRFRADLQRQLQLERCGWVFHRIPAPGYFSFREQAIERLVNHLDHLGIMPVG